MGVLAGSSSGSGLQAAEEFLHDELEYVIVYDWDSTTAARPVASRPDGRATFLVHPEPVRPYRWARSSSPPSV
jgi:hypothetical protein